MICEHCGAFFCADNVNESGPHVYCDARCRGNAKRKRKRSQHHPREHESRVRTRRRNRARKTQAPHQEASCQRKRHFPAMETAAAAWRKLPGCGGGVYKCGGCGDWHITSKDGVIVIAPGEPGRGCDR